MEMYRDSAIALFQAASHCCLYKFSPKHTPIKPCRPQLTDPSVELSISSEQSLTSFSVFKKLKIALVDLEILEKRYIMSFTSAETYLFLLGMELDQIKQEERMRALVERFIRIKEKRERLLLSLKRSGKYVFSFRFAHQSIDLLAI